MEKKWDGKGYASNVDYFKDEWEKNGNPLNVWRAYSECREACVEIPEWVYEYFDRVGDNFLYLLDAPPGKGKVSNAIAEALGMKAEGKGGRANVFADLNGHTDEMIMAHDVDCLIEDGHKPGLACEQVAGEAKKRTGKGSISTVSRAWKKWGIHKPQR